MSEEKKGVEKTTEKTEILVPIALAQELINYLQSRPYAEVYVLIGKLIESARNQGVK